jgi:hypothetical protein
LGKTGSFSRESFVPAFGGILASQIAGALLQFYHFEIHHAKNAYTAFLLIPGMEQLKFSAFFKKGKNVME